MSFNGILANQLDSKSAILQLFGRCLQIIHNIELSNLLMMCIREKCIIALINHMVALWLPTCKSNKIMPPTRHHYDIYYQKSSKNCPLLVYMGATQPIISHFVYWL